MGLFTWLFGSRKRQEKVRGEGLPLVAVGVPITNQLEAIHGRQILSNASYILPKDDEEINRLDFQHFMLRNVIQSNYVAPIKPDVGAILDVGCGTGRWGQEMALQFPQASVVGCDLLEQKAQNTLAPLNYRFIEGDVLKGLPFAQASFDFVHQRLLSLGMPAGAWQQEINELVRLVRPGGWLELVETELGGQNFGPACQQMAAWVIAASRLRGIDPANLPNIGKHLFTAGLSNIAIRQYPIPVGRWGGRLGVMMATDINAVTQAVKPLVVAKLGVAINDFDKIFQLQLQGWEDLHTTATFFAIYGQKPI